MPLTADELDELNQLNAQAGAPKGGLTPEEEKELAALNAGAGTQAEPSTSAVTAATTGLANGASLGTAGELAGFGKTAMDAITGTRGPLAGGSLSDLADDYAQSRDSFNSDVINSAKAHPAVSAAAHSVGAAVPIALSPVGEYIQAQRASNALPAVEKSASWAREGLSGALNDEGRRQVAAEIAKKVAKRAAKAVLFGH